MPALLLNPWFLAGVGALLAGGGVFADKTGEGINDASSGVLKIVIALAVLYVLAKKMRVI